jgi:3',5'-cyclic AMP phosphodiesterase CpdA
MLIAQMTDLHVVGRDQLCQGRVPTNAHLREAVAHLNGLDPRPDVVLATGDLTDHGTAEEYEVLREIVAALRPPLHLIPGNHDHRGRFLEAFADHAYLPRHGAPFAHYAVDEHPVRLIGLDTTVAGQHHGELCDERLAWLDATLGAAPRRPTMIFMHHPPFRTGIRWLDAVGLHGGRKMAEIVARHPQVQRIACGHVHRPIQAAWAGTIAAIAPSTSHAQVALALGESNGFDFAYQIEPRAIQLYLQDPEYGILSHVSYVSGAGETYLAGAARNREEFQRRYDELRRVEFEPR